MPHPETILKRPTVGDLIEALDRFPRDAPLRMLDADTDWTISTVHVGSAKTRYAVEDKFIEEPEGAVWLWGEYEEMGDGEPS